jgi:hypothetical protein
MVAVRDALGANRSAFHVEHRGYDTHNDNYGQFAALSGEVDAALADARRDRVQRHFNMPRERPSQSGPGKPLPF